MASTVCTATMELPYGNGAVLARTTQEPSRSLHSDGFGVASRGQRWRARHWRQARTTPFQGNQHNARCPYTCPRTTGIARGHVTVQRQTKTVLPALAFAQNASWAGTWRYVVDSSSLPPIGLIRYWPGRAIELDAVGSGKCGQTMMLGWSPRVCLYFRHDSHEGYFWTKIQA